MLRRLGIGQRPVSKSHGVPIHSPAVVGISPIPHGTPSLSFAVILMWPLTGNHSVHACNSLRPRPAASALIVESPKLFLVFRRQVCRSSAEHIALSITVPETSLRVYSRSYFYLFITFGHRTQLKAWPRRFFLHPGTWTADTYLSSIHLGHAMRDICTRHGFTAGTTVVTQSRQEKSFYPWVTATQPCSGEPKFDSHQQ
ncbi:hypothetical protein BDN67DRAFT_110274 [Paxillus ammoniavirescens]|nr:hypothetical protein BDN67DRAFT_110274 [Paxillus ammoniavirescens]